MSLSEKQKELIRDYILNINEKTDAGFDDEVLIEIVEKIVNENENEHHLFGKKFISAMHEKVLKEIKLIDAELSRIESMGNIRELCIEALKTDGGHHKQWYLEQILELSGYDVEKMRNQEDWTKGIAP